jgi:hypothetical protein
MMKQDAIQQTTPSRRRLSWSDLSGVTLLFLGLMFVAVNLLGVNRLENWWGLFIMLPGLLFVAMGWRGRGIDGRISIPARFSLGSGLVVLTVAVMFLLDLNWGTWWPLMIVMPGTALWLVGGGKAGVGGTAVLHLGRWFGFTMILLGLTFLADQLAIVNLQKLFGDFHWWGFFILIPGVGAFVEGIRVLHRATWTATALFIIGVWILSSGVTELLDPNWISWEGMVGIGLIGTGLVTRFLLITPDTANSA